MSIFIYIVMDYIYLYFLNKLYIFIGIEKINKINLHKQTQRKCPLSYSLYSFFLFSVDAISLWHSLYDVCHSVTCQYYLLITCITFLYICRNIHAILESALKFVLFYTTSMIFIHYFFFTEITLMSCLRAKPALKNQQ